MNLARRSFIKGLFFAVNGATALLLSFPVIGYILGPLLRKKETRWVEAGPVGAFEGPHPKPSRLKYASDTGFRESTTALTALIHVEGDKVTAFSTKCTHLGCNIIWKLDERRTGGGLYFCPCHGGEFDVGGNVVSGPPPAPMRRFPARIQSGKVYLEV